MLINEDFNNKISECIFDNPQIFFCYENILIHIKNAISEDKVNKTIVIQLSTILSSITKYDLINFIDFLERDNNFLNICKGPGFINLLKPIFQLCSTYANPAEIFTLKKLKSDLLDRFLVLFNINFDEIIFDKKTFKIIEKILKQNIISNEMIKIKDNLLNNLYNYASNHYSCHVLKVFFSVSNLSEKNFESLFKEIWNNIVKYCTNKYSSSLVISCLYVSLFI